MAKLLKKIVKLFKKKDPVIEKIPSEIIIQDTSDLYDIARELRIRLSFESGKSIKVDTPSEKYPNQYLCGELPVHSDTESVVPSDMASIYSFINYESFNVRFFKDSDFKRTLALPVDASQNSKFAVSWCKNYLFTKTDRIALVNIVNSRLITEHSPLHVPNLTVAPGDQGIIKQQHADEQCQLMQTFVDELKGFNVEYYVGVGDAKRDLVDFIDDLKPDLVVICQKQGIAKTVWETVGKFIIAHCNAPVLIIGRK
ncbi:hypothetical protein HDV01_002740 [Terramyces sp. JEL0728]|nr:hypothetical protein HDV01_002740 [Terramyces sp. JEL0728]